MSRRVAALFLASIAFSSVHASFDRAERPQKNRLIPLKSILSFAAVSAKNDDFRITEKTEVLLDGRPCRYEQVPDGATIVLLETETNETKEISRIHFRSPRRPASTTSK